MYHCQIRRELIISSRSDYAKLLRKAIKLGAVIERGTKHDKLIFPDGVIYPICNSSNIKSRILLHTKKDIEKWEKNRTKSL